MTDKLQICLALFAIAVGTVIGCSSDNTVQDMGDEEANLQLTPNDTHDSVRLGARLILNYDKQNEAFVGTVQNSTNSTLKHVRVEVHLSNGVELGPTTPADLQRNEIRDVRLDARGQVFDKWAAHAEVGSSGEGGSGGEGSEGGSEAGGEHGGGSHN